MNAVCSNVEAGSSFHFLKKSGGVSVTTCVDVSSINIGMLCKVGDM